MEDILQRIESELPWLDADIKDDVAQDVAMLILEGEIDLERLGAGIAKFLPELKRKYPSARFQISLDAPVGDDNTTATLGDFIHKSAPLPKRRKRIGRPRTRELVKLTCEWCGSIFYTKAAGYNLRKKERERAEFLPKIDRRFYTPQDVRILRVIKPRRFCGRHCVSSSLQNDRWNRDFSRKSRKRYDYSLIAHLYVDQHLSTPKIARIVGASEPKVINQILRRQGIKLRHGSDARTKYCIVEGCSKLAKKIRHAGNGAMYGTRCAYHRKLHYANLNMWLTRKKRNIPPERWINKESQ